MDERSYWGTLEHLVSHEMTSVAECRRVGMWCDGFLPETEDFASVPARIRGRVWIGLGPKRQEPWTFELLLPHSVGSRDRIRWPDLLPVDGTSWWTFDQGRKHLVVAPSI